MDFLINKCPDISIFTEIKMHEGPLKNLKYIDMKGDEE
jgi:hypothetical protein